MRRRKPRRLRTGSLFSIKCWGPTAKRWWRQLCLPSHLGFTAQCWLERRLSPRQTVPLLYGVSQWHLSRGERLETHVSSWLWGSSLSWGCEKQKSWDSPFSPLASVGRQTGKVVQWGLGLAPCVTKWPPSESQRAILQLFPELCVWP